MFFRHRAEPARHAATRSRGSDEAQLKELRARARRRLVGALALVLAAVIVVPWLFEEPVTDDTHAPIVVPAVPSGLPSAPPPAGTSGGAGPDATTASAQPQPATAQSTTDASPPEDSVAAAAGTTAPGTTAEPVPAPTDESQVAAASKPAVRPAPAPETKPAEPAKPASKPAERTDDGSVALALLAGKAPPAAASTSRATASQGRYVLQVAAYTAEQDALTRRDSLRQAGVTDAYVERGQSSGRTVFRLRVGPFGSHEAAQAAQARLRALGYQNGLISGN